MVFLFLEDKSFLLKSNNVNFTNEHGVLLSGKIDLPELSEAHNFVLFAHCFTCGKNLHALQNISKALTKEGFGVLRFDFTGLGRSEGEFSDSNFNQNISDLVFASKYLKGHYKAPTVLLGHSLGGSAALASASKIASLKAVVTIAAPFNPKHLLNSISIKEDNPSKQHIKANIGGRDFSINTVFIEALESSNPQKSIQGLNKALLVLHSPQDGIVEIENAKRIFENARHPKSFISLDGADHLLSNREDAKYAGIVVANWAKRYVVLPEHDKITLNGTATAVNYPDSIETNVVVGKHQLLFDEPEALGGMDFGPSPHEMLSASLAACTADVSDIFERELIINAALDDQSKERMLQIANKCPVHKTLQRIAEIPTKLTEKE